MVASSPSLPASSMNDGDSDSDGDGRNNSSKSDDSVSSGSNTDGGGGGGGSSKQQKAKEAAGDVTRRMICGGLAGMVAKTATNPLERIKMLSQTGEHGVVGTTAMKGSNRVTVLELYRDILRKEGVIGLWAGNGANLLRVFPAKAVVFSSNDVYRKLIRQITTGAPYHESSSSSKTPLSGIQSFLAGGMAGMTATACTYPLDFARGRISGKLVATKSGQTKVYGGIVQTVVITIKDEGFLALYKGVTPTLLGAMPYEGIKFGTVGLLEKLFPPEQQRSEDAGGPPPKPSPFRKMVYGGLGGVMAGLITYPNDTVRRMLQLQGSRGTSSSYGGYWDCVAKTYAEHGLARFYRGMTINIVRMAPNAAVQFGAYEMLKQYTSKWM